MSLCIFAYNLLLPTNHFPTVVAAVPIVCSSQFALYLIYSLNLTPRSPLLAVMTVSVIFSPITDPAAVVDCGGPPAAHVNGNPPVYSSTTFKSQVMYTCHLGYNPVGDRTITCLANGQWSASAPVCNRELTLQTLAASITSPIL